MTEKQIIFAIWGKIRPGIADEDSIDYREIAAEVHKQRALLIRNELNKGRTVDSNIIQDLGCVQLAVADRAECCDIDLDCDILRTSLTIPNAIELHHSNTLWVGPVDKLDYSFSFLPLERAKWAGNGKHNKRSIFAYLNNSRIYIFNKENNIQKMLQYINVRGVFEDPSQAARFSNCSSGSTCYNANTSNYPVNSWMLPYLEAQVIQNLTGKLRFPVDTTNDSSSNPTPQQGGVR